MVEGGRAEECQKMRSQNHMNKDGRVADQRESNLIKHGEVEAGRDAGRGQASHATSECIEETIESTVSCCSTCIAHFLSAKHHLFPYTQRRRLRVM
jgi:tRNA(Arg) A34 adenosine deaminase TadA